MHIEHFVICRASSIDKESNSLSLFDLVQELQVQAPSFPATITLHAVLIFRRSENEYGRDLTENFHFSVLSPKGTSLLAQEIPVKIQHKQFRQRARLNFPVSLEREGLYKFSLASKDSEAKTEVPVQVRLVKEVQAEDGLVQ